MCARRVVDSAGLVVIALIAMAMSTGCKWTRTDEPSKAAMAPWPPNPDADVTGPSSIDSNLPLDVYLDSTVSMQGFVAGGRSRYTRFLEDLESAAVARWPATEIHYFKFGARIRPLTTRQEFLAARTRPFYTEAGFAESTDIETVLRRVDPARLSIIISDLFEADGDVNPLVEQVKARVLPTGAAVGVLAVPSEFDGTVYDAGGPPFPYRSSADPSTFRPFYAFMVGSASAIDELVSSLAQQDYVSPELFALGARHVTRATSITLKRDSNLSPSNANGDFRWDRNDQPARLTATVALAVRAGVPAFDADRVEAEIEDATAGSAPVPTTLVSLIQAKGSPERLTLTFEASRLPDARPHEFHVTVRLPRGGYRLPSWVDDWSAPAPAGVARWRRSSPPSAR